MSVIDSSNAKEHSYPVYGRQFKSYRWYKPIIVFVLFIAVYLILGLAVCAAIAYIRLGGMPNFAELSTSNMFTNDYDEMELADAWQSAVGLSAVAVMIPSLWLVTKIVRDRPFSSYSSSRGGWSSKVFWKVFPVAFICISIPIIVDELVYKHNINNFQMKFTLASFAVVTLLGPLQCIAEEYVFRGLLMQTFGSWFRIPIVAVILESVLFAAMHPYDMMGKIGIVVTGVVFSLTAWMGRGIEASSAFHIANNMTIFYLQGMNLASITEATTTHDFILEVCTGVVFVIVIFIISRKTDWFSRIKKDDAAAWNARIDEKLARKEAKKTAKAEKIAAKNAKTGAHDESAPGKHFKQ